MWNVKNFKNFCNAIFANVLIETLWNVKDRRIYNRESGVSGINRNIVECKEKIWQGKVDATTAVLIETLWNVKSCIGCYNVLGCIVLIETLWNVKTVKLNEVFTLSQY